MLDKDIIENAISQFKLETAEGKEKLFTDITQLKAKMESRGLLDSSMTICEIRDLCAEAIKNRNQLAWQVLHRTVSTTDLSFSEGLSESQELSEKGNKAAR